MSSPPTKTRKITQGMSPPSFTAAKDGMIIVIVGPDGVKFHVHKALLEHHSEYFRNALRGPWKEAEEGVIALEDVEQLTFGLFVHWLYSGKFPVSQEDWDGALHTSSASWPVPENVIFATCVRAYIIGDRFLADNFRRATNNTIATTYRHVIFWYRSNLGLVDLAFAHISSSRAILQLFADAYRYSWVEEPMVPDAFTSDGQSKLPRALLRRVLRSYHDVGRGNSSAEVRLFYSRCYLEHMDENEKKECRLKHMEYNAKEDYGYFR